MLVFQFFDFCYWYVVIYVFVEVFYDLGDDYVCEVNNCQLLDMLDYGEIEDGGESCNDDICIVVFWYMNFFIVVRFFICFVFFFYFLECIMFVNVWYYGKVIEWRWGRGCLFQCMVILWVVSQVMVLVVVVNRNVYLNNEVENIQCNQYCIVGCNYQYGVELWVNLLV